MAMRASAAARSSGVGSVSTSRNGVSQVHMSIEVVWGAVERIYVHGSDS